MVGILGEGLLDVKKPWIGDVQKSLDYLLTLPQASMTSSEDPRGLTPPPKLT